MSVQTCPYEGKGYVAMNGSRGLQSARSARKVASVGSSRRGFTLIELLVTIAAVAVLSLGLAQIFAVTGRTVSAGRRLSNLTAAANVLERQLREDLSKLTREGFLLIRNEQTSTSIANAGSAPDTKRERRLDELVFFVNGQFSSVRLSPFDQRTARASAARVYYGHGLQRTDPPNTSVRFDDENLGALGFGDVASTGTNPNQYAGDWILARQLTLLVPPSSSSPDKLIQGSGAPLASAQNDNAWQIGLQPAAPSIFRNHRAEVQPSANDLVIASRYTGNQPVFASGTIDIAATDLATVRVLMQGANAPYSVSVATVAAPPGGGVMSIDTVSQQEWMELALPAASDRGERLRVEALPPNFLGIRDGSRPSNADLVTDPLVANQLALASTAFMPRCSEFIVEWSFGDTDQVSTSPTAGRLIWHGLTRPVLSNRDDPTSAVAYIVEQYNNSSVDAAEQAYTLRDGTPMKWPTSKDLINKVDAGGGGFGAGDPRLYAYFGFNDPTYSPAADRAYIPSSIPSGYTPKMLYIDNGLKGTYEPELGDLFNAPETIPWKWPKLLRITMSLVDAQDPTIEQTFQFIFSLPERPADSQ